MEGLFPKLRLELFTIPTIPILHPQVPKSLSTISALYGLKLNCNHFTKDPFEDDAFGDVFYDDRSDDDTTDSHPVPGLDGWKQDCGDDDDE